jgi:hypothetical protein
MTNRQICERLKLPDRTLRRYLQQIYKHDCELLIRPSAQDMAVASNTFIERLSMQAQLILSDIIKNDSTTPTEKLEGHNLLGEIQNAIHLLKQETPAAIARSLPFTPEKNKLISEETRGLNLKLVNSKELPMRYEPAASNSDNESK